MSRTWFVKLLITGGIYKKNSYLIFSLKILATESCFHRLLGNLAKVTQRKKKKIDWGICKLLIDLPHRNDCVTNCLSFNLHRGYKKRKNWLIINEKSNDRVHYQCYFNIHVVRVVRESTVIIYDVQRNVSFSCQCNNFNINYHFFGVFIMIKILYFCFMEN